MTASVHCTSFQIMVTIFSLVIKTLLTKLKSRDRLVSGLETKSKTDNITKVII